jgi:hypothetical protein
LGTCLDSTELENLDAASKMIVVVRYKGE